MSPEKIIIQKKSKRFHIYLEEKKNEILVFTLHFWLKRLHRINNTKDDNKYNSVNTK